MKKIIWSILAILLFSLTVTFISNEITIVNYNRGIYKENKLAMLGFMQPYVSYYNNGNIEFKHDNYNEAIVEYEKALRSGVPKNKECLVRINMALAMIETIDFESGSTEDALKTLKEARETLIEKGCADDKNSGHNADAQQLKNDIDKLIEEIENSSGESSDNNQQDSESNSDKKDKKDKKEQTTEEKLEELKEQSQKERDNNMEESAYMKYFNQEYYHGNVW